MNRKYRSRGIQSVGFRKWAKDNNRVILPDGTSISAGEIRQRESAERKAAKNNRVNITL